MKLLITASVITLSVVLSSTTARADNDTIKSVLGGVLGAIAVEVIKDANEQPQQQQEEIQWHNQHQSSGSSSNNQESKEAQRVRQTQSALQTLSFYDGKVDGISGAGTTDAIKSWEKEFKQQVDGNLSEEEFSLLRKLSSAGFKKNNDYIQAQKLGFEKQDDYQIFVKSGFKSKEDYLSAQQSGFLNKKEYEEAKSLGYQSKDEYNSSKSEEIKNLVSDMQFFLPNYKGNVDLDEITEHLVQLKPVMDGQWDDSYIEAAEQLKSYASTLNGFAEFQLNQENKRASEIALNKQNVIKEIASIKEYSSQFLRTNLTDSRAIDLSAAVKQLPDPASTMSVNQLTELSEQYMDALKDHGLYHDFKKWKNEHQNNNVASADQSTLATETATQKAPEKDKKTSFWQKIQQKLNPSIEPPLCDSDQSLKDIRNIYIQNPVHATPYALENVIEVFYKPDIGVRQCRGIALSNSGKNIIQFTYSQVGDASVDGFVLDTQIDPLTLEERQNLNNAMNLNNLMMLQGLFQ